MQYDFDDALQVLGRTPNVVTALLWDLPRDWVYGDEGTDTWSPISVVAHLIHGERADWMARVRMILEHGEGRIFEPFDRFAHVASARTTPLAELLDEFATLRQGNVATLRGLELTPGDFNRRGRHPDFGVVTLRQLLSTWVVHDLDHIGQIVRVMAKQYRPEVGPWDAYLPILRRP